MIAWQKTLLIVALSQFAATIGFQSATPFAPYYIQSLGINEPNDLKMWVALFTAATSLTLAVFAPIWGALGDRYGRRIMLLRANLGGVFVLIAMGLAPNVQTLIVLRLLQGMLCGSTTAAQTFVSVHSPQQRTGVVLGTISAAVFSGHMTGSFVGGLLAELYGYRLAFIFSGVFMMISSALILFGTHEKFVRPIAENDDPPEDHVKMLWGKIGPALPILTLMAAMGFVRMFDYAWLPLIVQEIHGSLKGASIRTGLLTAISGCAGFIAGPILGRLADKIAPPRIGKISAFGAGLMMIVMGLAHSFGMLFFGRFGTTFCAGGLDPVFHIWLAKTTPTESRGFIFGWAVTAKALGWMFAPLASGAVALIFGLRAVFFTAAVLFFLLIPLITLIVRYLPPDQPSVKKEGARETAR